MREYKAPQTGYENKPNKVFLAGSIEMGAAEDWQSRLTKLVSHLDVTILNPRRDDWDASWEQRIDNPQFFEQVNWELTAMEQSDLIVFYFSPGTKSPITLMELGLHANTVTPIVVCCPEGFWRKGNVDVVCARYHVPMVNTVEELAAYIQNLEEGFNPSF